MTKTLRIELADETPLYLLHEPVEKLLGTRSARLPNRSHIVDHSTTPTLDPMAKTYLRAAHWHRKPRSKRHRPRDRCLVTSHRIPDRRRHHRPSVEHLELSEHPIVLFGS